MSEAMLERKFPDLNEVLKVRHELMNQPPPGKQPCPNACEPLALSQLLTKSTTSETWHKCFLLSSELQDPWSHHLL